MQETSKHDVLSSQLNKLSEASHLLIVASERLIANSRDLLNRFAELKRDRVNRSGLESAALLNHFPNIRFAALMRSTRCCGPPVFCWR